ncbi:MAG: DUF1015 domain-containing protein [Candidatus Saganbacteria bacterium]|nr:DUF1015 domain-containing protein [Candidatus Saganbacteria bacterium]
MVKIFPFSGITYNKKRLNKPDKVFTPPYDVISEQEQKEFYDQHDFNFIRLNLGMEFPGDGEYNNKYIRSAAFLDGWLRHEILVREDKPAYYVYEQKFKIGSKQYSRIGFIGLLRLEDMGRGKVYPHEETHPKAKIDRLQLMRTTSANLECIFCLYSDEKIRINKELKKFMKRKPLHEATDKDKVKHRLWKVDRKASILKITKEMKDKAVFIADGHHRYEAALRYKNELKMKNTKFTEEEAYNHVMMYFTPLEDKGLVVLPIHRLVRNLSYFEPARFEQQLAEFYKVKPYPANKKNSKSVRKKLLKDLTKHGENAHCYALYLGKNRYYLLTLKDEKIVEDMVEEEKPKAWKRLDTTILHYTVFDSILGIAAETEEKVVYFKDADSAMDAVDQGKGQAAFLLNPTLIEQITAIASKLEKMPQKSTYFYPKLLSGLVINKIEHGEKITY